MTRPLALTFDVFGTVVDWRGSIIRECEDLLVAKGRAIAPDEFADAWRAGYRPAMDLVRNGEIPWANLDSLHRMILLELLERFGVTGLAEDEIDHLNRAWHRLDPWPDAVSGLGRLKRNFIVATLSNGNVALLVNMAKRAGLPWDVTLSSELARRYKPDPAVYLTAARLLGIAPAQCMMVAAHKEDLRAARDAGFQTAFVPRPFEHGPGAGIDSAADPGFDLTAPDFNALAAALS